MMLQRIFLLFFLIACSQYSFAQIRATTESGNKVLLFDNGTWKYDENNNSTAAGNVLPVAVAAAVVVEIDSSKEISTDAEELFYTSSPRLVKYFGESGGNIRCKLSCSNTKGSVKVHFGWEFPVSDGHRYFGMFKEGTIVTLTMQDEQAVELVMSDENSVRQFENRNYSAIFNATVPLTKAQLTALSKQPCSKMEVEWRKKAEKYDIEQKRFFMEALPTVF